VRTLDRACLSGAKNANFALEQGPVMARTILPAFVAATLLLLPAQALARRYHHADNDQPPPAPMVTVTPGPGISLQIPSNWIACEDDNEKLLTSADDSLDLKAKFCTLSANIRSKLRAFDPRPFHTLTVVFNYHRNQPITEKGMAQLTQSELDQVRGPMCDALGKPIAANGSSIESCEVRMGTLAGHPSLVSTLVGEEPTNATYKFIITSYEVSYPDGYMQIQFARSDVLRKFVQPELDAILNSVQITGTATLPSPDVAAPDDKTSPPPSAPSVPPSSI
jgi:hypothetical protein